MNRNKCVSAVMIAVLALCFSILTAASVFADSLVKITAPSNGETIKPGKVEIWTRFAQPPGLNGIAITDGRTSYIQSQYGVTYTPITFAIYKDGQYQYTIKADPDYLGFTGNGKKSTDTVLEEEGTYTITASVPQNPSESDSVTFKVEGEFDGLDYSDSFPDSTNAPVLSEGTSVKCTLTPSNEFTAVYRVRPSRSGRYLFLSSGAPKNIKCALYDDGYIDADYNQKGITCMSANLDSDKEYRFMVKGYVKKTDTVFSVGFINAENGGVLQSASEITLTEKCKNFSIAVCSGSKLPAGAVWRFSDDSSNNPIVSTDYTTSFSRGRPGSENYYDGDSFTLKALRNGTVTVMYVDEEANKVYGSWKIICQGITEKNTDKDNSSGSSTSSGDKASTNKDASKTDTTSKTSSKKATQITAKNKSYKAKKKAKVYTITLKSNKKAVQNVKVKLKVKGKTYSAKTNKKGQARFKIVNLKKKGKYPATISFAGNKTYMKATKKVTITVKK